MPPEKGDERVVNAGLSPAALPSLGGHGCRGCPLHTAKKGEVPPSPSSTHCPFTEEAFEGLRGVHLLVVAITTKRILGSATQEKAEVPPSALLDAFTPSEGDDLMFAPRHSPPPSVEARIEKGGVSPPLKVLETWFYCFNGL